MLQYFRRNAPRCERRTQRLCTSVDCSAAIEIPQRHRQSTNATQIERWSEYSMTIQAKKAIPVPEVEPRAPIPTQNLRVPGPTPVPPEVMAAQAAPMINHRGPEFSAIMKRVTPRLQYFFQTSSPVLTYPAAGTGGQEAAIANLFSTGDHVIAITIGAFGNRLATIAGKFGLNVTRVEFSWGEAADPEVVAEKL